VLADPTHDDHEHMRSWVGEWPEFDQAATDRVVRDMVGQVPPSVALLLGLIGDRVKLTPGGRLPPGAGPGHGLWTCASGGFRRAGG
jgi:hypothetical protein